jgi:hypothetical protein
VQCKTFASVNFSLVFVSTLRQTLFSTSAIKTCDYISIHENTIIKSSHHMNMRLLSTSQISRSNNERESDTMANDIHLWDSVDSVDDVDEVSSLFFFSTSGATVVVASMSDADVVGAIVGIC